jgi:hypothetical protein
MLRRSFLAGLLCAFALGTAAPPFLPGAGPVPPPTAPDTAHPGRKPITDSIAARAATSPAPDSAKPAAPSRADSSRFALAADSARTKRDSLPAVYRWDFPEGTDSCRAAQGALPCWRGARDLANQEIGWPGPRAWSLSLTHWRPLPQASPYFPFWKDSPYLSGGLPPPDRYSLRRTGGDLDGIEENWSPVTPLDTPITRLTWTRGALTLNQFDLRLERMLSGRAYLGLGYYTATADSAVYDYQFNVHQPYLAGWGFLGKLYAPIDRDSASLVLRGTSYAIHALSARPRLGFWLDSNRVVEAFLDQTRNSTSLAFPTGQPHSGTAAIPSGPDSMQALMPSRFSSLTEGILYGETHASWSAQAEAAHGSAEKNEVRGQGTGAARDELAGELYRLRARARGDGLLAKPSFSLEARSEFWTGDPLLGGAIGSRGWADAEEIEARVAPRLGPLVLEASAGMGRASRMTDREEWLPRFGGLARLDLPLGFAAEASASSRAEDPNWETLYRSNPARFRYANPELDPRIDRTLRGELSWSFARLSLAAGFDRFDGKDVWLPRALPGPEICGVLAGSVDRTLGGAACAENAAADSAGPAATGSRLPDSLALALRNYASETVDAWYLGLGLGLGNWSLDLRNRFVIARRVEDPDLKASQVDRAIPERVFQGRLGWKRSLVEDRLKVDLSWSWEWFSTRYAWAPDLKGNSGLAKLDEYLALDFEARMRIKTFTLYFDAMNLNHDRYATEPGVHPPGVNFRFGVDWVLWN